MEPKDIQAQVLMLQHVTAALWSNFIANSGVEPLATLTRVKEESLDSIEGIYGRVLGGPNLHEIIQRVLHHEEGFWTQVEENVRKHPRLG